MTIKTSGSLSMAEINSEFNRGNNLNAYRGVTWYTDDGNSGNFSSGTIGFNEFYGKRESPAWRFGEGSGSFSNYGSYGYAFLYVNGGQPYNQFQIYVWQNTNNQPTGLVIDSYLDNQGNYANSFYVSGGDPYWYPSGTTNYFYLQQRDQNGTWQVTNYFSIRS
jgi:hypothetical protein